MVSAQNYLLSIFHIPNVNCCTYFLQKRVICFPHFFLKISPQIDILVSLQEKRRREEREQKEREEQEARDRELEQQRLIEVSTRCQKEKRKEKVE